MFKIILSNSHETIPVGNLEEVRRILGLIQEGHSPIVCNNGIFNPSYLVAIIYDKQATESEAYLKELGFKTEVISEFAKLLTPKMKMLSDKERTKAQEETAREERKLK